MPYHRGAARRINVTKARIFPKDCQLNESCACAQDRLENAPRLVPFQFNVFPFFFFGRIFIAKIRSAISVLGISRRRDSSNAVRALAFALSLSLSLSLWHEKSRRFQAPPTGTRMGYNTDPGVPHFFYRSRRCRPSLRFPPQRFFLIKNRRERADSITRARPMPWACSTFHEDHLSKLQDQLSLPPSLPPFPVLPRAQHPQARNRGRFARCTTLRFWKMYYS